MKVFSLQCVQDRDIILAEGMTPYHNRLFHGLQEIVTTQCLPLGVGTRGSYVVMIDAQQLLYHAI